jgi:hypothetical protein
MSQHDDVNQERTQAPTMEARLLASADELRRAWMTCPVTPAEPVLDTLETVAEFMDRLVDDLRRRSEGVQPAAEQRAALLRLLDRASALLVERREQLCRLAVRIEDLTGTPWETVLSEVGLDMTAGRDPEPSNGRKRRDET